MNPPKKMKLGAVPAYLKGEHGIIVTRQTIYNWATAGKRGTTLRTSQNKAGQKITTDKWVDAFVATLPVY